MVAQFLAHKQVNFVNEWTIFKIIDTWYLILNANAANVKPLFGPESGRA